MTELQAEEPLVYTIKDRCKMCYTCVRECPAKAIRIINGQAEVIHDRCIACGNCVRVCTRKAKNFRKSTDQVNALLQDKTPVIAMVAPSFPADFPELSDYRKFVGMTRELGFEQVTEVSFGADLVALRYKDLLTRDSDKRFISSDCPAIVNFVRKYHPHLAENLAPIVSPVMALARVLKKMHGDKYKLVFIGPCVAKKEESDEVDAVLSFAEYREMLEDSNILPENCTAEEFDPPHSGRGSIFPISRGIIQTINVHENLFKGNIVVAEGRINFKDAIQEFDYGLINDHHLELLCCEGCIMGPGMSRNGKRYENRAHITRYVKDKMINLDVDKWEKDLEDFQDLDLFRSFNTDDQRVKSPDIDEINALWSAMGKNQPEDRLNCQACGYESCEEHAIAVLRGLAEIDMCLPYTIEKLHQSIDELNTKNEKLTSIQQALKQSEKLAHLGQLSAGIAHELNNPLGVVIMYSNMLLDEAGENPELKEDYKMIADQAARCKKIVSNLLNFARKNQVKPDNVSILTLIQKSIKSFIIPDKVSINIHNHLNNTQAYLDEEQMIQALTNIIKNGTEAMPDGGNLKVLLSSDEDNILIEVIDEGSGIPEDIREKIFTPFFTTKGIGKGTGLGLPTTYGIIKMHKGKITLVSNTNPADGPTGTNFKITIPRHPNVEA
ncbi:MAG TPA: [Fe-Fe] hydrogenase large subunit C-terminal domain-containing protein [Bacteroidales bacterium]|nr:[Fe-Fe] hydrogenase large subunit C-terminal domain-containing protein [Bacteroidales bacterium]